MKRYIYSLFVCLVFASACKDDSADELPEEEFLEVATEIAEGVTDSKAVFKGKVIAKGKSDVQEVGFSYWVQGNLGTRKSVVATYNESNQTFTAEVTKLSSYTDYAYIAYAEDKETKEEGDILNVKTEVADGVVLPQVKATGLDYLSYSKATLGGQLITDGNSEQTTTFFYLWEKGTVNKEKSLEAEFEEGSDKGIAPVKDLKPGTEYAYTMVSINELGTAVSDTVFFLTNAMVYVDLEATGDGDGSSWENAFTSIKEAVESVPSGVQLWIAEGLYTEKGIPLRKGYDWYGGFTGTETALEQRDWMENKTIVGRSKEDYEADPNSNNYQIISSQFKNKHDRAILDGITFQYAHGGHGGVFNCQIGSPQVSNCTFENNRASASGGAMYVRNSASARFFNCVFKNNFAIHEGGAVRTWTTLENVIFDECVFIGNESDRNKGGALFLKQHVSIRNCVIRENTAQAGRGAGIYVESGACPTFIGNNVIEGNLVGGDIAGPGSNGCQP
ncbi:hypothetical protein FUAX_23910 [Fulvitalea axinellae]|uniref:Right handed beta helix domain-containing protein n=1 Tax=Fulvitalea axinellae TaxID=1182444 RepID=A0AAU9CCW7_9BACT|nr:hypothetical protein FUAX_23910 [Fulvitalea axinellae]